MGKDFSPSKAVPSGHKDFVKSLDPKNYGKGGSKSPSKPSKSSNNGEGGPDSKGNQGRSRGGLER